MALTLSEKQLTYQDKTIYAPSESILSGRSLFDTFSVPTWDKRYTYISTTYKGKAKKTGNRATDIPVGDEKKIETTSRITEWSYAIEYSVQELGEAKQIGDDLVERKSKEALRSMAEYENKLIFKGEDNADADTKIYGLTSDPTKVGFQNDDASTALGDSLVNLCGTDSKKVLAYFKDMKSKITKLPGNTNLKPILVISEDIESALDTPYNEYAETTVEDRIKKYFSQIKVIPEFDGVNIGKNKQDLAMIMLNDKITAGIPLAMPVQRFQTEYKDMRFKTPYMERMGGVAFRKPENFVQLQNLIAKKD